VFTQGDPSDTLIVVVSGRIKLVVRSVDGGAGSLASNCRQADSVAVGQLTDSRVAGWA
jgi:CRP-like cAMP-binding protein